MMNSQEIETALRVGTPMVVLIWNDSEYGLITWHQLRRFGRPSHIGFNNPDFVKYAESFGAKGYRIERAVGLIERLTSEEFKPENYKDEYRIRVLGMLDEKSKGKEIVIGKAPAPKHGQVIDIMEALKRSMERVPAKKKPATTAAATKKKKTLS